MDFAQRRRRGGQERRSRVTSTRTDPDLHPTPVLRGQGDALRRYNGFLDGNIDGVTNLVGAFSYRSSNRETMRDTEWAGSLRSSSMAGIARPGRAAAYSASKTTG